MSVAVHSWFCLVSSSRRYFVAEVFEWFAHGREIEARNTTTHNIPISEFDPMIKS